MIKFAFSIGTQPYRETINFVSYIHVIYSYNDVTTLIYMRTNYIRHLANIIEWSRPVGGGGGRALLPTTFILFFVFHTEFS